MKALRDYLELTDTTQAEFAKRIGVEQPTVSDWVNGEHKPRADMLVRISQITGISIDKLLADAKAA